MRFSWQMTTTLHMFEGEDGFAAEMRTGNASTTWQPRKLPGGTWPRIMWGCRSEARTQDGVKDRFRTTGSPEGLTVINNNAGNRKVGIAAMIDVGRIAKVPDIRSTRFSR